MDNVSDKVLDMLLAVEMLMALRYMVLDLTDIFETSKSKILPKQNICGASISVGSSIT